MSTWTSKACGLLLLALAACVGGEGLAGKPRSVPVLEGALQVGAPPGYCVAPSASRQNADTAVVLLGRCSDAVKAVPAVITVSVGGSGTSRAILAGAPALAAYFTSPAGRAALSRDGRASSLRLIEARSVGDAFLMRLQDRVVGEYWRGVVGVKGRLVTISVTPAGAALPQEAGRKVLDAALLATRMANKAP